MSGDCWALVPVKARALGKTRLAATLSECQRTALVRDLLRHVVAALRDTAGIDRIALISAECDELTDVELIADRGLGLNACIVDGVRIARRGGAGFALVVPADLPALRSEELALLLAAGRRSGFAIAPDRHGGGTNGLCFDVTLPLRFQFGRDSFQRHLHAASALGLAPAVVRAQGLAFDLDDADDWALWTGVQRSASGFPVEIKRCSSESAVPPRRTIRSPT
jgi:2-phospho-L-lactate guanylyltransferase